MNKFSSETELAKVIIAYLEDLQWEVYQEVQPTANGPYADIVATQGPLIWVIETKLSFGLAVIEQAHYWLNRSHLVSVATPYVKNDRMARFVCQQFGIGYLYITENKWEKCLETVEGLAPKLHRTAYIKRLKNALIPEHKTFAEAGNSNGRRLTNFGLTCAEVKRFVAKNPGCTIKELVDGIKTHYKTVSSARNSLAQWIGDGKVPGVRLDYSSGKGIVVLAPTEPVAETKRQRPE